MRTRRRISGLAICGALVATAADADIVCPDSSYVDVDFACVFTGTYRTGEPRDIITVSPDGGGETFAENGISLRVYLRNCQGEPLVGVPAESISLAANYFCVCEGGSIADAPTGEDGSTTFSGTLRAGGCVDSLLLIVDGFITATVPVRTNSPDEFFAWPCVVSADERARLGGDMSSSHYNRCFDFNEDGLLDAVDWSILLSRYSTSNTCSSSSGLRGRRDIPSAPSRRPGRAP